MRVDRSGLPRLGPDPTFVFPTIEKHILRGGLRLWTVEHRGIPMVTWVLLLPTGSAADPGDLPGLAALTGDLLDEGAGEYDALGLSDALARTGSELDLEVGSDATILTLTSLVRRTDKALSLLADVATRPRFEPVEFARVRELRLNRLMQLRTLPPAIADRVFTETVFAGHPYGHLPIGTDASLRRITMDEVRTFHARYYGPGDATLIAVGDGSHDDLLTWAAGVFGGWRAPDRSAPALIPDADGQPSRRAVFVHRPAAAQSELRVGHVAAARSTPDYHALLVLNMVLGGQFVSRLNLKLREERGFTYGARSVFDFRRRRGPFLIQVSVQSNATAEALAEIVRELEAIRGDRPVTAEELGLARAALIRGYPRGFETAEQIARGTVQLALYGLPDDYFSRFAPTVSAVDARQVTEVAARHLDPSRLTAVVVGDRSVAAPALKALDVGAVKEVMSSEL